MPKLTTTDRSTSVFEWIELKVKKKLFLFSPLASLVVVLEWFPNDVDDKKVQESQSRLSASSRMPAERGIRHDFAVFFCSTNERISRLASDSGARAERFLGEGVKFLLRLNEGWLSD
jgi:hypothetical protein